MESAHNYSITHFFEKDHKMDIETSLETNHQNIIKNYCFSKRGMGSLPGKKSAYLTRKKLSLPPVLNNSNIDIIKTMNDIMSLINDLSSKKSLNIFNIKNINFEDVENILLENLKKLRKELSKENIPITKLKNVLNNKIQIFIEALIELLKNNNDENIQLESLWIINNLIFFISKYGSNILFDSNKICNLVINYLKKIEKKETPKYMLIEIIMRIFGNLIHINNNIIDNLFNNKIIYSIINYLNNPVSSFRTTCLWVLNKIIFALRKNNSTGYAKYFINQNAISNYNFVFSRIKKHIIIDEMSELFWLLCELAKDDPTILIPIFFSNTSNIYNFINFNQIKNEYALNNFSFILNNSLINKMSQISFRLISNLLVVCNNELKDEYLLNKFIEMIFEKKSVHLFLNDVLNSPKNKYDISLVKDVLLLIFNLLCLSPIKSSIFFKKGIVNLISDRDFQINVEVMKILYMAFYRILVSSYNAFEPNDEKVIRACLSVFKRIKDEENILIIFIEILYCYLKASKTNINNEIEIELQSFRFEQYPSIEKYQAIFLELANIVKMYSPLSKFMRNM